MDETLRRLERAVQEDAADPEAARRLERALLRSGKREAVRALYRFKYLCPLRYEELEHTEQPGVSQCGRCQEAVRFVRNPAELAEQVAAGHCVAFLRGELGAAFDGLAADERLHTATGEPAPCVVPTDLPHVTLRPEELSLSALELIPAWVARMYQVCPMTVDAAGILRLAMASPPSTGLRDVLKRLDLPEVQPVLTDPAAIRRALEAHYEAEEPRGTLVGRVAARPERHGLSPRELVRDLLAVHGQPGLTPRPGLTPERTDRRVAACESGTLAPAFLEGLEEAVGDALHALLVVVQRRSWPAEWVPAINERLLAVIARCEDDGVRALAVRRLALQLDPQGEAQAVPRLLALARSADLAQDLQSSRAAVEQLGSLSSELATLALCALARDEQLRTRQRARAVSALDTTLAMTHPIVSELAAHPDATLRGAAQSVLPRLPEALQLLRQALAREPLATLREGLVAGFAQLPGRQAQDDLWAIARDAAEAEQVRAPAIAALGLGLTPWDEAAILALIEDPQPRVREAAQLRLPELNSDAAWTALCGLAADKDAPAAARRFALESLVRIPAEARDQLAELCAHPAPWLRRLALQRAPLLDAPRAAQLLEAGLRREADAGERRELLRVVDRVGGESRQALLWRLIRDEGQAAVIRLEALARVSLADEPAWTLVEAWAEHADPTLRRAAYGRLGDLPHGRGLARVPQALREEPDYWALSALVGMLRRHGGADAARALLELSAEESERVPDGLRRHAREVREVIRRRLERA